MTALVGPTAVGKTEVALRIARARGWEIISCDSMQVYRGMNIGTAKPSPQERREIPHHLIDIAEPEEKYDVASFLRDAERALSDIRARAAAPLVTGGTPMYLKAFLFGLFEGPPADEEMRSRLKAEALEKGTLALWERLRATDAKAAARIHSNDLMRIIRALEVREKTGSSISALQRQWEGDNPPRDALVIALSRPRDALYRRIDERVDRMFENGFVDEVRSLKDRLGPTARKALGYAEVVEYLDGKQGLDDAVRATKNNTHNFARKQMTWYRALKNVNWIEVEENAAETAEEAIKIIEESGK